MDRNLLQAAVVFRNFQVSEGAFVIFQESGKNIRSFGISRVFENSSEIFKKFKKFLKFSEFLEIDENS
jgi:hypothetical protein